MPTTKLLLVSFVFLMFSCSDATKDTIESTNADVALLFSKNPKGYNELYKLHKGEQTLLLSDSNYDFWWPKVSPDKSKILVYRSAVNPDKNHDDYLNAELLLINIDGTNLQVLLPKNANGWNAQGVCRWNKDGTKILMCAEVDTNVGLQWRLVETDALGKNPKILSNYWAIDCNYSVDNSSVVFMGFANNELSFDLTKLELQKGRYSKENNEITNIVSLTQNSSRDHDPDFSPDATKIVFSGGNAEYSNVDLLLYDVNTNKESVLLDDANANGGSMCWSPDGKYVYFHSLEVFKTPFRIKKINVTTKEVQTVLETTDNNYGFYHPEAY
ncbi:WD40 repeat protein [Maribacter vaceletii]|uniref:WD40 repeat protein n=1 Tax=Maribacter vaceletii TaxID=1206816 RepID=A0A495E7C9_9FLAO|nr:PD40 domain-containing protein [Maribacter vaceletii]RKR12413.1 WD40 repeat protein [Maribacter vaceletii]